MKCYSNAFKKHQNNTGTICLNIILRTCDMFLHNGLPELHIVFMTRTATFFRSTVFTISRWSSKGNPRKVYFEDAKKQAFNYGENVLCCRCFSWNLAKVCRMTILTKLFWCIQSKSQYSTRLLNRQCSLPL